MRNVKNKVEEGNKYAVAGKISANLKLDESVQKRLENFGECIHEYYTTRYEYFPYIKGDKDKKLYIVNLYGDKLVITDNMENAICFMEKESIYEFADKINMDLTIHIEEVPLEIKYFRFSADGFEMILKVYYHKNLDIDLEYIRKNVSGNYISMLASVEEIHEYRGSNVDGYLIIDNKGMIVNE